MSNETTSAEPSDEVKQMYRVPVYRTNHHLWIIKRRPANPKKKEDYWARIAMEREDIWVFKRSMYEHEYRKYDGWGINETLYQRMQKQSTKMVQWSVGSPHLPGWIYHLFVDVSLFVQAVQPEQRKNKKNYGEPQCIVSTQIARLNDFPVRVFNVPEQLVYLTASDRIRIAMNTQVSNDEPPVYQTQGLCILTGSLINTNTWTGFKMLSHTLTGLPEGDNLPHGRPFKLILPTKGST